MRYLLLLVLGMTAFFTHAQSVNNPQPEIATRKSSDGRLDKTFRRK